MYVKVPCVKYSGAGYCKADERAWFFGLLPSSCICANSMRKDEICEKYWKNKPDYDAPGASNFPAFKLHIPMPPCKPPRPSTVIMSEYDTVGYTHKCSYCGGKYNANKHTKCPSCGGQNI